MPPPKVNTRIEVKNIYPLFIELNIVHTVKFEFVTPQRDRDYHGCDRNRLLCDTLMDKRMENGGHSFRRGSGRSFIPTPRRMLAFQHHTLVL